MKLLTAKLAQLGLYANLFLIINLKYPLYPIR